MSRSALAPCPAPAAPARSGTDSPLLAALAPALARALAGLRYGSVELVVHDGRVVQIERRERLRVDAYQTPGGAAPRLEEPSRRPPDLRSRNGSRAGEEE